MLSAFCGPGFPWSPVLCLPSPGEMLHMKEMIPGHHGTCLCCCLVGSVVLCYWQSNFQLRVNPQQPQWFSQARGRPGVVLIVMGREDIVGIITVIPQGWTSSVLATGAQPVLADTRWFYQLPKLPAGHCRPALPLRPAFQL